MAQGTFTVGAVVAHFHWRSGGPNWRKQDNTDVYSGTVEFIGSAEPTTPAVDMARLASLWRDVNFRPTPASSGGGFFADYNGTADPSGVLVLSDGTSLPNIVLTSFQRSTWRTEFQEADVEFKRVV